MASIAVSITLGYLIVLDNAHLISFFSRQTCQLGCFRRSMRLARSFLTVPTSRALALIQGSARPYNRLFSASTAMRGDPFKPAARVAGQRQDVWSIVNEAAAASDKPIVNMGQGFFGYNPPPFVIEAAKSALDRVECNQYSPTKVLPRRGIPSIQPHQH